MAPVMNAHQRALYDAQLRIFNKLCAAFMRSRQTPDFRLPMESVRSELNIPVNIFREALERFYDVAGERIVIVIEHKGDRYITLGGSAKSNVSDWVGTPQPVVGLRSLTSAQSTGLINGFRYAGAVIKNR